MVNPAPLAMPMAQLSLCPDRPRYLGGMKLGSRSIESPDDELLGSFSLTATVLVASWWPPGRARDTRPKPGVFMTMIEAVVVVAAVGVVVGVVGVVLSKPRRWW